MHVNDVYSLTREGYRAWITSLYCPVVVVGTTEQAQNDIQCATQTPYSYSNNISTILQPFGTLPTKTSEDSSPSNVFVRLGDQKTKILDSFSVRFVEPRVPLSYVEAHESIFQQINNHSPPTEVLQLKHTFHCHSVRNVHGVERESLVQNTRTPCELKRNMSSCHTDSHLAQDSTPQWIASYPHSAIRQTDTYRKAEHYDSCLYPSCAHEFTAYDTYYTRMFSDSFLSTSNKYIFNVWWELWLREYYKLLFYYDDNTLCVPYTIVYVVSSNDTDPVGAIQKLMQSMQCNTRAIAEINACRCFVVVDGDSQTGSSDSMETTLNALRQAYPPSSCHRLSLRTATNAEEFLEKNKNVLQQLASVAILQAVIPTLERLTKRLADCLVQRNRGLRNQLRSLWTRSARGLGATGFFSDTTLQEQTTEIFWGFNTTGAKTGITDKIKRPLDSPGSGQVMVGSDPQGLGGELCGRILGDVLFFLGEYHQAAAVYRNVIADNRHQKNIRQQAQALHCLALCSIFASPNVTKADFEPLFDEAALLYNEINLPHFAFLVHLTCTRAMLSLDIQLAPGEAAQRMERLSFDVVPELVPLDTLTMEQQKILSRAQCLRSALLLEQVAIAYSGQRARFSRRMSFFFILAGHSYSKSGLKAHALRCYSFTLRYLGDCRWCCISDHLLFSLARQSYSLGYLADSVIFFSHLLSNLVMQSSKSLDHYTPPYYSRTTAFSCQPHHFLLPDSCCIPQPARCSQSSLIFNANREAVYIKEALFVFKTWYIEMDNRLSLLTSSEDRQFLNAFRRLRYELFLPCLHKDYRVYLESIIPMEDGEANALDDYVAEMERDFQLHITEKEKEELRNPLNISEKRKSCTMLTRYSAVKETVWLELTLTNPLLVPLECFHMKPYYTLEESSQGILLSPLLMACDASKVICESQHIQLKPKQTMSVTFCIVPQTSGVLEIHGLMWDLYNVIKMYTPLDLCSNVKQRKHVLHYVVEHPDVAQNIQLPGDVPRADSVSFGLNKCDHDISLCLSNSPLSSASIFQRGLLLSQFLSNSPFRQQQLMLCHAKKNHIITVSNAFPRLDIAFPEWPASLLHGERRFTQLVIHNKGNVALSAVRLRSAHKSFCFFLHKRNLTYNLYWDEPLLAGQNISFSVIIRGSYPGKHNLLFYCAADTLDVSTREHTVPTRRWFSRYHRLQVSEHMYLGIVHAPHASNIDQFTATAVFKNTLHLPQPQDSVVTVTHIQCFLSGTTRALELHMPNPTKGYTPLTRFLVEHNIPLQLVFTVTYPSDCVKSGLCESSHREKTQDLSLFLLHAMNSTLPSHITSSSQDTPRFTLHTSSSSPPYCNTSHGESNQSSTSCDNSAVTCHAAVDYVIHWVRNDTQGEIVLLNNLLMNHSTCALRCQVFPTPKQSSTPIGCLTTPCEANTWTTRTVSLTVYNMSFNTSYVVRFLLGSKLIDLPLPPQHNRSTDCLPIFTPTSCCMENDQTHVASSHNAQQYTEAMILGYSEMETPVLRPGEIHTTQLLVFLPKPGIYTLSNQSLQIQASVYESQTRKRLDTHCQVHLTHTPVLFYLPHVLEHAPQNPLSS